MTKAGSSLLPGDWVSYAVAPDISLSSDLRSANASLSFPFGQIHLYIKWHPGQPPTHSFQPPCWCPELWPRCSWRPLQHTDAVPPLPDLDAQRGITEPFPGRPPRVLPAGLLRVTCTAFSGSTHGKNSSQKEETPMFTCWFWNRSPPVSNLLLTIQEATRLEKVCVCVGGRYLPDAMDRAREQVRRPETRFRGRWRHEKAEWRG